ncbi:hypothetical protein PghCCS26_47170 [Paenibacillus glycanilyticus]|uniref:Uncharacterized protein n=1 Tax=Paenibacillus glycanilyticus TaxID=126569 RepID=A0ABQ6NTN9_9BACL|nr:hypothetical protein [Paenibacillus glycanilyticus]GMK47587.1 hypothetical protein PghCCS26_47170 [Paenibacillus glycanilyticus]
MNNVMITASYALAADDTQFTLQRKHLVDPTRSPWYKPEMGVEIREDWRPIGYYPLTPDGLASAVRSAIVRDVNNATEARTIADLLSSYLRETARINNAISAAMFPQLNDDAAPVASE